MSNLDLNPLRTLPSKAADYIDAHGWIQGAEEDGDGQVCLTGALRLCSPVPGDSYIAREVFRRRDHAENWNDARGRTADEVIEYLAASEITDADLADTFGPQWRLIVAQVRLISGASPQQILDLAAARDAAWTAAWDAARDAAWDAAWDAARAAAWGAARAAARCATWAAAWDATLATLVRDLITPKQHGLLMAPWRTVIGDQA